MFMGILVEVEMKSVPNISYPNVFDTRQYWYCFIL